MLLSCNPKHAKPFVLVSLNPIQEVTFEHRPIRLDEFEVHLYVMLFSLERIEDWIFGQLQGFFLIRSGRRAEWENSHCYTFASFL